MTEEDEVYKKAFDCAYKNSTIDKAVLDKIIQLENHYTLRGDPHHDNQVLKILFNEEIFQTELKTAIDEKSKQEKAFEKLKKAVTENKKVIKQIEGLKRNKGIAIIGNNHDLISGIASYLWLTSPLIYPGTPQIWLEMSPIRQKFFDAVGKYINGKNGFCYINCDGVNETELHKELFKDIVTPPGLPCWVLFLRNINNSHDNIVKRLLGAMRDVGGQGNFIISTDNLPEDLKVQFEVIELDAEKQDKTVDILQSKTKSEDSNIKNKTLFFDDNTNYLWFSEDKKTRIEGEDAKLVKAMLDMTKKENRHCCRKEEIILKAYGITVEINKKIPQKIANKLNTSKSTINKKCKLGLDIKELIQRDGVKLLKYSINVERRKL